MKVLLIITINEEILIMKICSTITKNDNYQDNINFFVDNTVKSLKALLPYGTDAVQQYIKMSIDSTIQYDIFRFSDEGLRDVLLSIGIDEENELNSIMHKIADYKVPKKFCFQSDEDYAKYPCDEVFNSLKNAVIKEGFVDEEYFDNISIQREQDFLNNIGNVANFESIDLYCD